METHAVHCKSSEYDIYIGRPSKWGNPFIIGRDGNRDEVITKYREFILHQPHLLRDLHELRGKVLGCWCSPHPCHGDVLAELANEQLEACEIYNEVMEDHYRYGSGE
jgi:hypothetical protein